MSPSIPFNSPSMSLSFYRYVRFIASDFPTSSFVFFGFIVLAVPPHSPCFSFFPLHVPFSSPSCPFQFPCISLSFPLAFLSCQPCMSLQFPAFPTLISLHFLAFPLRSPVFFRKRKTRFSYAFAKRMSNTQSFFIFSAKRGRQPEPAKSRQGDSGGLHIHVLPSCCGSFFVPGTLFGLL